MPEAGDGWCGVSAARKSLTDRQGYDRPARLLAVVGQKPSFVKVGFRVG